MRLAVTCLFILLGIVMHTPAVGQDSTIANLPHDYLDKISSKSTALGQKLDNKTDKALMQMARLEARIKKKLSRMDSAKAKEIFGDADDQYKSLQQRLENGLPNQYIPSLDTLCTSLKFLEANQKWLSQTKGVQQKLKHALGKVNGLETRFQKAEEVKRFLKERKKYLKERLTQFGFGKEVKKLNKQVYYYSQQLSEYKALLKDKKKAEKKAIELLSKTRIFKEFMRKHGMLASLFPMPGDPNDPSTQFTMAGLQTRAQVNSLIQQQLSIGGPNAQSQFRQNLQEAQGRMNELRARVDRLGGNSDGELPEGFEPNSQKTKKFWDRIEIATNIQTHKSTRFFPATSDLGLSLGFKPNDKSIIGVGASYKLGLGTGWNHLRFSHQGIGLRSFVDYKIKGSFWLTGGYERNHKDAFSDFSQLRARNAWQTSGLLGLTKVVSLKTKFFKKTKLQLLWDFVSYEQVPRTQPILFRIGYTLK